MIVRHVVVVGIVLAWVSIACGSMAVVPARKTQNTQSNTAPAAKPVAQEEAGGFAGCETLPGDLPFLENATEASDYQGWCSYKTATDYPAAVDFYRTQLAAKGWEEFRTTETDQGGTSATHFYYEKSDRKVAIGIISTAGIVIVTIYPEHWIDEPCEGGGVGLPTPTDIPILGNMIGSCSEEYPWSETGEGYYTYQYTTLESFEEVLRFYREATLKAGWSLTREYAQDQIVELDFEKPGRTGTVQAGMDHFVEVPLDSMRIQIMKLGKYDDTTVKIMIDGGR